MIPLEFKIQLILFFKLISINFIILNDLKLIITRINTIASNFKQVKTNI